jgi:hypothetical protein
LGTILTFQFVCLGWIFFKAGDFTIASTMLHQITFDLQPALFIDFIKGYWSVVAMMVLGFFMHAIPNHWANAVCTLLQPLKLGWYILVFFLFLLVYGYFKSAEPVLPIYLQF